MVTQFESQILKLLAEEIVPAEGCTEPIALAYCASLVTDALGGRLADRMDVYLSGNMIKNVKSVPMLKAKWASRQPLQWAQYSERARKS